MFALSPKWKASVAATLVVFLLYLTSCQSADREAVEPPRAVSNEQPKKQPSPPQSLERPPPEPWFLPPALLTEPGIEQAQPASTSLPRFEDLQQRIYSDGVDAVVESLAQTTSTPEISRLPQSLDLSRHILRDEPQQLWFQLFSRTRMAKSSQIDRMLSQSRTGTGLTPRFVSLDQAGGPLIRIMQGKSRGVLAVAVSPDGERIASGHGNGSLAMWELATGKQIWSVKGYNSMVDGVAFAPDGKSVGGVSNDRSVVIWDAENGNKQHSITIRSNGGYALDFSPDGRTLAIGSDGFAGSDPPDDILTLWNFKSGQTRVFRGHQLNVKSVDFSPDGRRLVSGSHDKTIKIWDVDSGSELQSIDAFKGAVSSVVYSLDGKTIAASSFFDPDIKLFSAETGELVGTLEGHRQGVTQLAYSNDGKHLASAGQNCRVKRWDMGSGKELPTEGLHTNVVNSVQFTPDDRFVVSGSSDKSIRVWDLMGDSGLNPPCWHDGFVHAVALSADGELLATGGSDGLIRILDAKSGKGVRQISGRFKVTTKIAFSPDGGQLASLHGDRVLRIWDIASGEIAAELEGPKGKNHDRFPGMSRLVSFAFSPDGSRIAAAGHSSLIVWDIASLA